MGDKTQVIAVALAARFHDFIGVVSGTTLGMTLANIPIIYLGHRFADHLPARTVHVVAALIFVLLGLLALRNAIAGAPLVPT
jgi:putative Ca2+/H+ antiporter (TMEM165/GDT1 family)